MSVSPKLRWATDTRTRRGAAPPAAAAFGKTKSERQVAVWKAARGNGRRARARALALQWGGAWDWGSREAPAI